LSLDQLKSAGIQRLK